MTSQNNHSARRTDSLTRIPGKDEALEISIDKMRNQLKALGFEVVEKSWLNPVSNVWSVHIADADCPLCFTNGKGASKKAALASALGEYFERLACNYFFADYYLGDDIAQADFVHYPDERWFPLDKGDATPWPTDLLTAELKALYDPDNELRLSDLVDTNSGATSRGVCALPYQRQRDGQTVYFPVNLIGNLFVSNGMSAGNTATEARVQALSEIFERWVKFKVIAEAITLPEVPAHVIARYPKIAQGIADLQAAGFGIQVRDASLGGKYPVMVVTLLNPQDQGVFASFGAHPRFEVALERALTELLQGRALEQLNGFPEPGFDQQDIAEWQNLETHFIDSGGVVHWNFLRDAADHAFVDWNFAGDTAAEYRHLLDKLHAEGHDVYIADYDHLGVYACRILVPGVSEIYQPEDLIWDNNNAGVPLREALLSLASLSRQERQALAETLENAGHDDMLPMAILLGIAPDADTHFADLRLGELKLLLALANGDKAAIVEGCHWVRHFGQLDAERTALYRAVEHLVQLPEPRRWQKATAALFAPQTLARARELLAGHGVFDSLPQSSLKLEGFDSHGQLLAAYAKLQRAKTRATGSRVSDQPTPADEC